MFRCSRVRVIFKARQNRIKLKIFVVTLFDVTNVSNRRGQLNASYKWVDLSVYCVTFRQYYSITGCKRQAETSGVNQPDTTIWQLIPFIHRWPLLILAVGCQSQTQVPLSIKLPHCVRGQWITTKCLLSEISYSKLFPISHFILFPKLERLIRKKLLLILYALISFLSHTISSDAVLANTSKGMYTFITWPKIFDFGQVLFSSACMCLSVCVSVCGSIISKST